ncbi:MAG: metallophosphoesterase [Cyanobacteria bacterium P01_A01_bin.116]
MTLFSKRAAPFNRAAKESVLSQQVQWQHSKIVQGGIDQTQLAIADAPTAETPFSFLVVGDTDAGGVTHPAERDTFADAFANQLTKQLGESRFLLHTGDVTYPVGSYRNYLAGFLQPYQDLLSRLPESPADLAASVMFNKPVLPVPGNHDYAGLSGVEGVWRSFMRLACDQLRSTLGIDLGNYGGEGGEAYGQTFLDDLKKLTAEQLSAHLKRHYSASAAGDFQHCLSYRPGEFTRLPNRYYKFRYGGVDFFALDSNTWNRAPEIEGFDGAQLEWLEKSLITSWDTPNTVGRIIFCHHSAYTTESTRWQSVETLWVRRNLRTVLDRAASTLGDARRASNVDDRVLGSRSRTEPLVDLVISGHAHCLEHIRTVDTKHADANIDWVVCCGSGSGLRRQRGADTSDILESMSWQGRSSTKVVANSQFYAGVHGQGAKKQHFHSFLRIDVQPQASQKFKICPHIVTKGEGNWTTTAITPLAIDQFSEYASVGA